MRDALLEYLACRKCGGDFELRADVRDNDEIVDGALACSGCGGQFAISRGVPRMNEEMERLERVAQTFGYEWKAHHAGQLEADTLFGRTLEEDWQYFLQATKVSEERLRGAVVLDAGCGSGRLTRQVAEHGAGAVLGIDINEAVDEAFASCRDLANVHIVQANVLALPLKKGIFDLVWSQGVIHHTPDAAGAHRALAERVKPGGVLYVWVYAKRFNPFRFTKDVLDALRVTRLPEHQVLGLSKLFARMSLGILWAYQQVRRLPGLRPRSVWAQRKVRLRTVRELELTWFDALSPEYDSRHSEDEVVGWFERAGFRDIQAIEEPKVGVRGVAPGR
jgi:SAM-dependent methyltransferase